MDGWIMDNVILFVVVDDDDFCCDDDDDDDLLHSQTSHFYLPTYLPTSFFEYSYSLPPEYGVKCSYLSYPIHQHNIDYTRT